MRIQSDYAIQCTIALKAKLECNYLLIVQWKRETGLRVLDILAVDARNPFMGQFEVNSQVPEGR